MRLMETLYKDIQKTYKEIKRSSNEDKERLTRN